MQTTIDIPEELFRQIKARAAWEGIRLHDFVEKSLRLALAAPLVMDSLPTRIKLPLHHSRVPGTLSAEEVYRAEEQAQLDEDIALGSALRR